MTGGAETPLMQQYREIKSRNNHAILFFRMGEFYEMFFEDAETASRVLGLTLTSRNNGSAAAVPLAGVPVKAAADYVQRLVQSGYRVAICEQVEDPKSAKGIVKREVIETITPGASFSDELLDQSRNNFICAIVSVAASKSGDAMLGVAAADVSTGEFRLATVSPADLEPLLARLTPREMVVARGAPAIVLDNVLVTEREPWEFDASLARDELAAMFSVHSLDGLGIDASDAPAVGAAGGLLRYLRELQPSGLPQLGRPTLEHSGGTMPLDGMTRRNLELVESLRGGAEGTLLSVLDRTCTAMGARLLRQWILAPLTDRARIDERLDGVTAMIANAIAMATLRETLDSVRDVERLSAKAAAARCTPRELRALADSIGRLPAVEKSLRAVGAAGVLAPVLDGWDGCDSLGETLRVALVTHPPMAIGEEPTIAAGADAELDSLRELRDGGKDAIARIQAEERQRTGIASLKVAFNRVFGYYIEVSKSNLALVPSDYQRRQTIANGERFVTPALKEYEERVLTATERIEARERAIFERLRASAGAEIGRLQRVSRAVALADVVAALADVAQREGYVRPIVNDGFSLEIEGGRHPVVERMMPRDRFIPNDLHLDADGRVIILTGPNMAGKSTVLRQAGLIVLMAQAGCYVPARSATIGVADRVFTRVGASDNLVRGQSTFMVEMAETSAILHSATARSLVLLDEIGRGTSTYDGVSIAWAVSEYMHDDIGCKTIFATHYHELTQLADLLPAVRNFTVAVREVGDQVLFLHRLEPGGADRSYGIEVGRLAGLPARVLGRAREVLQLLEGEQIARGRVIPNPANAPIVVREQLSLFAAPPHPVVDALRAVDPDRLTPLDALSLLATLVEQARR